ncbi:hypothetical protein B0T19DRAFT_212079 [Cercophora scortea]|uniref:Transmembrane protein n=1 Tax=Cercophora scortea TaxID=314031 RepID=A0AAE0M9Q4_9PEZI|nr:hypothetical protein B0T19DRAFT_212079 [Cercophora scortea]
MADQVPPLPRPPPQALARPQLARRQSRFTEEIQEPVSVAPPPPPRMQEYTPTNSIYEPAAVEDYNAYITNSGFHNNANGAAGGASTSTQMILRGVAGCIHGAVCVMLMAIMVQFLNQWRGEWFRYMSPLAIALLVLLALDTLLDVACLIRLNRPWPSWALLLRLVLGIGYLAVFMVYVGFGHVFPFGFTYWAMKPGYAGPVVYLFLWLLGPSIRVWNLLHTAIRRHRLGNGVRQYLAALPSLSLPHSSSSRTNSPHLRSPTTRPSSRLRAWRTRRHERNRAGALRVIDDDDEEEDLERNTLSISRGTTLENNSSSSPAISLHERPTAETKARSLTTTTTGSSHGGRKSEERGVFSGSNNGGNLNEGLGTALSPPPGELKL